VRRVRPVAPVQTLRWSRHTVESFFDLAT
jgi:hypothetical protein